MAEDNGSPLTPAVLGTMWPKVRPGLRRALLRSGADEDAVDDALAEAVTRALGRRLSVGSPEDLSRWLFVVARNLVADGGRSRRRLVSLPEVPERVDGYDLALHVEHRQRLRATADAFAGLSASDQAAIRSAIGPSADCQRLRESPGATAVRRHRARSRLRGVVGAPVVLVTRIRTSSWDSAGLRNALAASVAGPLLMATAMLVAPSDDNEAPAPPVSVLMASVTPEQEAKTATEATLPAVAVAATPRTAAVRPSSPPTTEATKKAPGRGRLGELREREEEVVRRGTITIMMDAPPGLPNVGLLGL